MLSVDEKTHIQALDRPHPELPLRVGPPRRLTTTYKRHGTVNLVAALAVHSGEVIGRAVDRNPGENFVQFLKALDRTYRHVTIHAILENLSVHKHKQVQAWLARKRKLQVHSTPTYASWLNQIEIWVSILTRAILKGGVWHSKKHPVDQLMEYIQHYNETQAKPCQWTYGKQYFTN